MNWNGYFYELFQMVQTKKMDTPQEMDIFLRKVQKSDNLVKIGFFIWRVYYANENKDLDWWKALFREFLNATKEALPKKYSLLKQKADEKGEFYKDRDIAQVFLHIYKEVANENNRRESNN